MAKSYYLSANVNIQAGAGAGDTWASWVTKFNVVTYDMGTVVVTTDSSTNGALTTGNAYVNGIFTANTLSAIIGIQGGTASTPANLNIISNTHVLNNSWLSDANTTFSNTILFQNVVTASANVNVTGSVVTFGNATVNVVSNSTVITIGNSSVNAAINSTSFSGTSNNSLYLGGAAAAVYVNTSGAFTIAGVHTHNANIALVGNTTAILNIGQAAANIIANSTTVVLSTNSTVSATLNSTTYSATANNATNLGGQAASYYTNATNITTGTLPYAQLGANVVNTSGSFTITGVETFNANIALVGNTTAELLIGAAAANIIANATTIYLSTNATVNATLNSTVYSATANNATNLNGQAASYYTNATNIATGTLPWAQAPTNSVNTSGAFTFTGVHTLNANLVLVGNTTDQILLGNSTVNTSINSSGFFLGGAAYSSFSNGTAYTFSAVQTLNANLAIVGNTTAELLIGAAAANIIANSTTITLQTNSTVSATVNSTIYSGQALTANNATNLGGQVASFYTNASNINAGALAVNFLSASGTANTTTFLRGDGTWGVPQGNSVATSPGGSNTDIQFNNSGTFGGWDYFQFVMANVSGNVGGGTLTIGASQSGGVANASVNAVIISANTQTAQIVVGNNTVTTTINSTAFSGTANNATNLGGQAASYYGNATNITTGTLPMAQLNANVVNTSGSFTITGVHTHNANVAIVGNTTAELLIGAAAANIVANSTAIILATNSTVSATINSTAFSGTSANATNLNSQPGSYYTNATNISTGTLPYAQLGANVVNTSGNFTITGVDTFNANLAIVGNTTAVLDIGQAAANIIANSTGILLQTNATVNATINSTTYSGTANNATNLNGQAASYYTNASNITTGTLPVTANNATNFNGQAASYYTNATNITTGTLPYAQLGAAVVNTSGAFTFSGIQTFNANIVMTGNATNEIIVGNSTVNTVVNATGFYINGTAVGSSFSNGTSYTWSAVETFNANIALVGNTTAELLIGAAAANIVANSTALLLQTNSTVSATLNSTAFSGTSANATNLNSQPGSYYTNATNISTGTLPYAQLGANVVNTSGSFTLTGGITFNSEVIINAASISIGNGTLNAVANSTTFVIGNATVNSTVNSTAFSGAANNASYLGGTAAASYQLNSTLAANVATMTANNSNNFNGQAAAYYANATNITSGTLPMAQLNANVVNTSGSFTITGVDTFNANVAIVGNTTAELLIGAAAANIIANSTTITLQTNSTVSATINSTAYSATANNATNFDGQAPGYYTNATNISTGTLPYAQLGANVVNTSAAFTITGVHTYNVNVNMSNNIVNSPELQSYKEYVNTITISTNTQTLDLSGTNIFNLILANSSITLTFINPPANNISYSFSIIARQDSTGSRTIIFPNTVYWSNNSEPSQTTIANNADMFTLQTINGGNTYMAGLAMGNTAA